MLHGSLNQPHANRSSVRYRYRRTDVVGFNLRGHDGSGGDFSLLMADGNNIIIEGGINRNLNINSPISP